MAKSKNKNIINKIIGIPAMAILLAVAIALTSVCIAMADTINAFLVMGSTNASQESLNQSAKDGEALATQIEQEGIVLLKNQTENGEPLLPLDIDEIEEVNVFGWAASDWITGGSGSACTINNQTKKLGAGIGFLEALEEFGIDYNYDIIDMYESYFAKKPYMESTLGDSDGTLHAYDWQFSRIYEPDISDERYYSEDLLDDALNFSDTAFVVIGRHAGESDDAPQEQYKGIQRNITDKGTVDSTRKYLEISTEEEALLTYVGSEYENVVVIINSTNAMELGFMETIPGLDACLYVGGTGINAATAIPYIIYGENAEGDYVSPSGKLTDTLAYEMESSAAYATAGKKGVGMYTNATKAENLYPLIVQNDNDYLKPSYAGIYYVDYVENIYVGYKWYETADAEGYWKDVDNKYGKGYDGIVQYPFGYGLSYTEFEWEITGVSIPEGSNLKKDDNIEITLSVTNVGDHPGQDVIQVYYNPPYYKNGIEKSSSNLCAFAKTEVLEPGITQQNIKVSFSAEDMALYDCYDKNGDKKTGYVLEKGEYEITLRTDCHTLGPVKKGSDVGATIVYNVEEHIYYETGANGNKVDNKFTGEDAIDGEPLDGSGTNANIKYLSRSSFKTTFTSKKASNRQMTQAMKDVNLYSDARARADWSDSNKDGMPTTSIKTGVNNGVKVYQNGEITELGRKLGGDFNSEEWDKVLNQMSLDEMKNLVLHGYPQTAAVPSIGKPRTQDSDGPNQWGSWSGMGTYGVDAILTVGYPCQTVLGQTWNSKLAYSYGKSVAIEGKLLGFDGWNAPAINIHRTPLSGRNYEYYSEDPYLTGIMGAGVVRGAKKAGAHSIVKHFICYDQDTYRDSIYVWTTEQAMRELNLKPFKILLDEANFVGLMTSYNRIGSVWAGGSKALLTGVLREEWGYNGAVITDYSDHHNFMSMTQALYAGGDYWMDGWMQNGSFQLSDAEINSSNKFKNALRTASKHILYMWLSSLTEQYNYNQDVLAGKLDPEEQATQLIKKEDGFAWWIPVLIGVDAILLGGCVGLGFWVWKPKSKKQEDEPVAQAA